VPSLRERIQDLPDLVNHFQSLLAVDGKPSAFDANAMHELARHSWQGNVRELQNAVAGLGVTADHTIGGDDVRRFLKSSRPTEGTFSTSVLRSLSLKELQQQLEREYLVQLRRDCEGDLHAVAKQLGITRRALYVRFQKLGIRPRGE
jgi:DNA-binding NtrC family response regulator